MGKGIWKHLPSDTFSLFHFRALAVTLRWKAAKTGWNPAQERVSASIRIATRSQLEFVQERHCYYTFIWGLALKADSTSKVFYTLHWCQLTMSIVAAALHKVERSERGHVVDNWHQFVVRLQCQICCTALRQGCEKSHSLVSIAFWWLEQKVDKTTPN